MADRSFARYKGMKIDIGNKIKILARDFKYILALTRRNTRIVYKQVNFSVFFRYETDCVFNILNTRNIRFNKVNIIGIFRRECL